MELVGTAGSYRAADSLTSGIGVYYKACHCITWANPPVRSLSKGHDHLLRKVRPVLKIPPFPPLEKGGIGAASHCF